MKEIVVATNNEHKLSEIIDVIRFWGIKCYSLHDFANSVQYDEPYFSFVENALHKAREVSRIVSLPVIADDSGLCVDALHGDPGVLSARYSELGTDEANRKKLLLNMQGVSNRRAFFVCVTVFIRRWDDPCPLVANGFWSGEIAIEEKGTHGFGYDVIFQPDGCQQTVAEMPPSSKNKLSHRAQSLRKMQEEVSWWLN